MFNGREEKDKIKKRFRLSHCRIYYQGGIFKGALTLLMGVRNRHIGMSWTGIKMPTIENWRVSSALIYNSTQQIYDNILKADENIMLF